MNKQLNNSEKLLIEVIYSPSTNGEKKISISCKIEFKVRKMLLNFQENKISIRKEKKNHAN